jgi:DNA-binding MarR family transcriptional regulator
MSDLDTTAAEVLTASRALLGVVARSLAPILDQVTIPQFRVLVVLSTAAAPVRNGDLAAMLGVHPSTFTRTADRLVAGGWVVRAENPENRRETLVQLSHEGRRLVDEVTEHRRREISSILSRLDTSDRRLVLEAMAAFARAAGEPHAVELIALGV